MKSKIKIVNGTNLLKIFVAQFAILSNSICIKTNALYSGNLLKIIRVFCVYWCAKNRHIANCWTYHMNPPRRDYNTGNRMMPSEVGHTHMSARQWLAIKDYCHFISFLILFGWKYTPKNYHCFNGTITHCHKKLNLL